MKNAEIHMTARQRAAVAELLADTSRPERLGACSLRAEASDVVVLFEHSYVVVGETGRQA